MRDKLADMQRKPEASVAYMSSACLLPRAKGPYGPKIYLRFCHYMHVCVSMECRMLLLVQCITQFIYLAGKWGKPRSRIRQRLSVEDAGK